MCRRFLFRVQRVRRPNALGVRRRNASGASASEGPSVYSESSISATMAAAASAETTCLAIFS
jgi:hypothetical protein